MQNEEWQKEIKIGGFIPSNVVSTTFNPHPLHITLPPPYATRPWRHIMQRLQGLEVSVVYTLQSIGEVLHVLHTNIFYFIFISVCTAVICSTLYRIDFWYYIRLTQGVDKPLNYRNIALQIKKKHISKLFSFSLLMFNK